MSLPGISSAGMHGHRVVVPGNQTFTVSGTFNVPDYNTLNVKVWGGGGEGGPAGPGTQYGVSGAPSSFQGLAAGEGHGGRSGGDPSGNTGSGNGGTASGGNVANTAGNAGQNGGVGAGAPNGGGNVGANVNGSEPGGGGGGGDGGRLGGGSGGYVEHNYAIGFFAIGAALAVTVATPTAGGSNGAEGARGEVRFSWT